MADKNLYYVHASNEAGTSGERPEIEASSEEEAMQIYRELSGNTFPVLRVELKQQVDDDPETGDERVSAGERSARRF